MALLSQATRADRTFERLYRKHAASVYRYAYGVLQNRADAEDVTQTTFMNAYRALERGEQPQAPHNWLITIAHNVCRQRFRQSQRRPNEVAWHDDVADTLVADDDAPTAEDIRRALSFLPFNQRAALVLRELEGRSYAEIAAMLELSVSAVETLIFRARRALREQLEGSLTCGEAELAISKQLDGRLSRAEKGALRAHLRECPECATFARRQRGQRSALKSLGSVPLPAALSSLFGGGGSTTAGLVAAKAAAVVTAAAVVGGGSYEAVHEALPHRHAVALRAPAAHAVRPARPVAAVALPSSPQRPAPAVTQTPHAVVPASPEHRHRGPLGRDDGGGHGRRHHVVSRTFTRRGTGGEGHGHDGPSSDRGSHSRRSAPPAPVFSGGAAVSHGQDSGGGNGQGQGSAGDQGGDQGEGHGQGQTQGQGNGNGNANGHGQGHGNAESSGASFSMERHLHLRTCPRPHPGTLPPAGSGDAGAGEPAGSPASPFHRRSDSVGGTKGVGWGSSIDATQSSAGQC